MRTSRSPARVASSTTYWIAGLSTTGNISFGVALVAGRNRVPSPAAGITALVTAPGAGANEASGCVEVMPPTVAGQAARYGRLGRVAPPTRDEVPQSPHEPRARASSRAGQAVAASPPSGAAAIPCP